MDVSNGLGMTRKGIAVMEKKRIDIERGFTHGGNFHADDVFSSALLRILNPHIEILRGNVVPEEFDGIIYDVGRGKFDHHQNQKLYRENGIPYAAFGLLWKEFGRLLLTDADAEAFDKDFIQQMDLSDNTGEYHELSRIISDFNPAWDAEVSIDERFLEAVDFAQTILKNRIQKILAKRKAQKEVMRLLDEQEGSVLVMDRFHPWKDVVCASDKLFVIFPSARGGYMIQAVPKSADAVEIKKAFPVEWRGKTKEELKEITGIETFTFCHMSGFICSADTIEDAKKIVQLSERCVGIC